MPQELQLPDGRVLVIPDNITLDQRAALRNKLGAQYADVRTGKGMEQRAQQQARQVLTGTGEQGRYDVTGRKVSGPQGQPLSYMERAEQEQSGREAKLGERINRASRAPTPLTSASALYAPVPAARAIIGSTVGSRTGGAIAKGAGASPQTQRYSELAGGLVGGAAGSYTPGAATRLTQRITRGPGGAGDVVLNPITAAARELEARVPRNEPPGLREEMQMELGQQQSDAIARENLAQRAAARQAAQRGRAVPVSQSPGPYRGPSSVRQPETTEEITPTGTPQQPSSLSQRASVGKRLVLTPEEATSQANLDRIAAEEAKRRGMRSAAWGQQGQP